MQRFSTTALTLALTALATATSLALIAAAYLMATYLLEGMGKVAPSL